MASSDLFQNLRKYVKGQIDVNELVSSDPYIRTIRENSTKGLSRIIFDFKNNDEFFKYLDIGDDDAWFANIITNPYGDGYNFQDSSMTDEDFKNGYIVFYNFDEENRERMKNILKVIDPGFDYSDFPRSDETNSRAATVLLKLFEKETNRLVDDYSMEREIAANNDARDHVKKQIRKVLEEKGFKLQDEFDAVSIDVGHLIMLYLQYGKIWLTFKGLFKQAFEGNQELGGWTENSYEFYSESDVEPESFNRDVSNYLDKIESYLEDGQYEEFGEMIDRITSKFKPGVTYNLPKLKDVQFRIKDFDRDDMKVVVTLRNKLKSIERKVSEENFYNLLYQPELFDFGFGNV